MSSLPPALLEQLLTELSTLASVYHKPPETFVGQGRFGADSIQHAAIQEQIDEAADNPIAAASIINPGASVNNDNLLDIDFDGAAPASAEAPPSAGASGLEGLAGTPQRVASPEAAQPGGSSMDDMMGLFDMSGPSAAAAPGQIDLMNGFAGLDLGGASQPPPAQTQLQGQKKTNEDLLGMF
jgi:hypothetical protein